jgi:NADH-quinone oxidoreductase subunit F
MLRKVHHSPVPYQLNSSNVLTLAAESFLSGRSEFLHWRFEMEKTNTVILPELSMFLNTLHFQMGNSRSALLPCLHAAQDFTGYISDEAVLDISQSLEIPVDEIEDVIAFYTLFHRQPAGRIVLHVCNDPQCKMAGVDTVFKTMRSRNSGDQHSCEDVEKSPCLGLCCHKPTINIQNGLLRIPMKQELNRQPGVSANHSMTPVMGPNRIITRNCGKNRTCELMEYWSNDGYQALKFALTQPRESIMGEIKASCLTGRGGDSFLTGIKWEKTVGAEPKTRFVICNAAEADPTSFKDRVLMEDDPHSVLEGMIITGYILQASKGYIYLNGEYELADQVLSNAVMDARETGLLGTNIMGSKFSFDIEIRRGAGRYISGEETAMLESLEGKCAYPRGKPPFPTSIGLFGKPTIINNVETYCCIPKVLRMGAMEFRKIGTDTSKGTILISISGDVVNPGLVEIPFGLTFREVVEGLCGGVADGHSVQTVLVGGVNGKFLRAEELDTPISLDILTRSNLSLGPGSLVVLNESRKISLILSSITRFLAEECCGKCPSCVEGTAWQMELFDRPGKTKITKEELCRLNDLDDLMQKRTICRLGKTALNAAFSAINNWPDQFL